MRNENLDTPGSQNLRQAFLACLRAALAVIRQHSSGQALPIRTRVTPRRTSHTTVSFPTVAEYDVTFVVARLFDSIKNLPEFQELRLKILRSQYADSVFVDAAAKPIKNADAQSHWLMNFYIMPLLHDYIRRDGLLEFDQNRAQGAYADLEAFLKSSEVAYSFLGPLKNFQGPDGDVEFDSDTKIRTLEDAELEHLWDLSELGGLIDRSDIIHFRSCVETVSTADKLAQPDYVQTRRRLNNIVTALRLLKPGQVGIPAVVQRSLGRVFGPMSGTRSSSHAPVPFGPAYSLEPEDRESTTSIYQALEGTRREPDLEVALSRFNFAYARLRPEDRLVDYWIALEALFLPEEPPQELSYRASLRVAYLLEQDPESRQEVFRQARRSYQARSAIVHGRTFEDVPTIAATIEDILRRALRRAVENPGAVNVTELDSRILRGS